MFDLVYPEDIAPVVPAPDSAPAGDRLAGKVLPSAEWFPVIEDTGLVTGRATRAYCHSGAKVLHPVVHLHIIDRAGRLYLQKRSMKKDIQPGKWDTAVGGHVDYGESIVEALYREAEEELGMTMFNPVRIVSYVFESDREREMVNVFAAVGNFSPVPDKDEIDEGRFWEMQDIEESLGKSVFTPNFEGEFVKIKDRLTALL